MNQLIAHNQKIAIKMTTAEDLDFVLQTENAPENARFIGQWTRSQHQNAIADSDVAHWMVQAQPDFRNIGYLILLSINSPHRNIEIKRIAIAEKGKGYGRQTLQLVKQQAFERLHAHRLWLDVMEHNDPARHLYKSVGFVKEGTLRECIKVGDRFVSLVVLSMLEDEYRKEIETQTGGEL